MPDKDKDKVGIHGFEIEGVTEEFRVVSFSGTEGISRLFNYGIYLASESSQALFSGKVLGQPATLKIQGTRTMATGGEVRKVHREPRFVHGMISRFLRIGARERFTLYYAELVPQLWLLTQKSNCRIFQDNTVPEIIKKALSEADILPKDYGIQTVLRKEYQPREYCVQYRETDFNFISRLMEEEGIFYYFKTVGAKEKYDTMVMGDEISSYANLPCQWKNPQDPEASKIVFHEPTGQVSDDEAEYVYEYRYGERIRPGSAALRDFDYLNYKYSQENPAPPLEGRVWINKDNHLEFYDYHPGKFKTAADGNRLAGVRLEELRTIGQSGAGRSNSCRFLSGACFTLAGHSQKELNRKYLLTEVTHAGSEREAMEEVAGDIGKEMATTALDTLMSSLPSIGPVSPQFIFSALKKLAEVLSPTQEKDFLYRNEFSCIPASASYRPPRLTPRPVIQGPQTAMVVAPGTEKLHMDEFGRVKVKFHWDRDNNNDSERTCYIRVAGNYAGMNHGMQFPPLAGDEVVVDFLEGDPDKPLIVGSVYNSLNRPPLEPKNKIENVILTPYQHRLMLNDRTSSITLNTGGGEKIEMIDDKEGSDFGKQIMISTADKHYMHLLKGAKGSGIQMKTQSGHKFVMWDASKAGIMLKDKEENLSLFFNSDTKTITIENKTNQEIRIECQNGKISIIGGSVEVAGGSVQITGTEGVKINSGAKVEIAAPEVTIQGSLVKIN